MWRDAKYMKNSNGDIGVPYGVPTWTGEKGLGDP